MTLKTLLPVFALLMLFTGLAVAQDAVPDMPDPIRNLVDEGAQIRYLGNDHGVEAWLTIKNGREQYFYVLPNGKAFLMGVLFNNKGELVTVDQVRRLREQGDNLLDSLASDAAAFGLRDDNATSEAFEFKSPSERLFHDIENSNWVPLGQQSAPVVYSFIDPQCPHCHKFIEDLQAGGYLETGQIQLRLIPVGFKNETRAQAAFLMATPNPQERWYRHMQGDESALPARSDLNQQGVQRNLSIMQAWKLNVTPMIIYRDKNGTIKVIRGRPQSPEVLISDLG